MIRTTTRTCRRRGMRVLLPEARALCVSVNATHRVTAVWQGSLDRLALPRISPDRQAARNDFITPRTADGGAPPES